MLELQILLNHYPSSHIPVSFLKGGSLDSSIFLFLQGGIYLKHPSEILFSIAKGKRAVALDDFCISIYISLGIMPHTKTILLP